MPVCLIERPTASIPSKYTTALYQRPKYSVPIHEQCSVLTDWWHEATDALSSPSQKVRHRAYQRLINLGVHALPCILEDLRDRGGYWFYALERITGISPLPKDKPASFESVKKAWLDWGRGQGLI